MENKAIQISTEFFSKQEGKEILLSIRSFFIESYKNEKARRGNLNLVNSFISENLQDPSIEHQIKSFLMNNWEQKSPNSRYNSAQKADIINTGFSVVTNMLKVKMLEHEKYTLDKILQNDQEFFQECQHEINELKAKIEKNQADFAALEKQSKDMTLAELAHVINEFHDPNLDTSISDDELEYFFNGGTLEL